MDFTAPRMVTMTAPFDVLGAELAQRAEAGLLRRRRLVDGMQQPQLIVDGQDMLAFCSNDYLGLASAPELLAALQQAAGESGTGSGASHLISGHHRLHHALEHALAQFVGLPGALLFSTGYMANLGVVTALLGRDDAIFADRLNHASLNDAALLSRAALRRYPHNDLHALEKLLSGSTARRKLVVTDAVFSMDGDIARLPELLALCERHDAWLLVDDAHGFGVLGEHGGGVLEHFGLAAPRIIYMATLGKAAGVSGAFVAGEPQLIDYLVQTAHTYIYTTAAPPALAGALLAALPMMRRPERRDHLQQLISSLRAKLSLRRWHLGASVTPIQPVMIGSNDEALAASDYLRSCNILVPAIRPPTVPQNTARLRISLSAAHSPDQVQRLVDALHAAEKALAA